MATLTVYPDPNVEVSTVDGASLNNPGGGATWATVRAAGSGTFTTDAAAQSTIARANFDGADYAIARGFFLFDTSSLTVNATITAAVMSFVTDSGQVLVDADTTSLDIVSSSPASNTAIVDADYSQIGSTSFGSKTFASWVFDSVTYNNITLNASGISNISKTSISKFGTRNSRDTANSAPTGMNTLVVYMADQTGTSTDPMLVITYTLPGGTTGPNLLSLMGVG